MALPAHVKEFLSMLGYTDINQQHQVLISFLRASGIDDLNSIDWNYFNHWSATQYMFNN